jgi:hypothetical protein
MIEFTSEPRKSINRVKLVIVLGVSILLLGGTAFFLYHQRNTQASSGSKAITVPGLLRPGNTNFEYYKTKIRIENIRGTLGISYSNARIASISGIVINEGDRRLEALELHITLYDKWGKVSKERTAFAFHPGTGFGGKPLEPLQKRSFTIGIESVEFYWDPKQISYEITGLKYL